ncbi:NFX1-type zinc finger-containing protein 1 [Gastrophryne carolinensis]
MVAKTGAFKDRNPQGSGRLLNARENLMAPWAVKYLMVCSRILFVFMDFPGRPLERPHANRQNENRARLMPERGLHNITRPIQQLHINEDGRQLGARRQHQQIAGELNAPRVGRQHDQRPVPVGHLHGAARNHEQREGEHRAGRRYEQPGRHNRCGGVGGQNQRQQRAVGQQIRGAGEWNERRGEERHGPGPRVENEPRPGDHENNHWRRGNHNHERRENQRQQQQRPLPIRDQKVRHLGFKALEELLEKEPSEVAITLAAHPCLKDILSATDMRPDLVELLCKVMCKACTARLERQSIQYLLGKVKSSAYLRICIPHYIVGIITEHVPERRQCYPENIQNIINLLQEIISIFPASSIQEISMVLAVIPASINSLRATGIEVVNAIEQDLERVSNFIQTLQERKREGGLRVDMHMAIGPEVPAEGFRTLSVYPTHDEIHLNEKPFLRANTIKQKFETTAIYLDTHFRLLREDFVRPLREGIQDILQYDDQRGIDKLKFDDIRVYFDTRIINPMCTSSGIAYKVRFDVTPLKWVRWQNSKRLLYGSLVCMSQDNFESLLFATVAQRDEKELEKGEIQLYFSEQSKELLARANPTDSYIMVETTAYFEAYRHVLEGLQEMDIQEVPFQKHIVSCEKDVGPPRYLNADSQYDIHCILNKDKSTGTKRKINILNPSEWPAKESLGLDESQMEALQLALTKELAIIQGPPGTGKTYVGLKIAQALLTNINLWGTIGHPVLVVCYTNHALDQFLEGIHQFLRTDIVRVGGRSSSEVLKKFNLKELRESYRKQRICPHNIHKAYTEIVRDMKMAEEKIQEGGGLIQCSTAGVIREKFLHKYIKEEHWHNLHNTMDDEDLFYTPGRKEMSVLIEWLGLGPYQFIQGAGARAGPQADLHELDEEEPQDEELVDVKEEADLIQAERELDDEDEYGTEARRKRKAKMVEDEELASLMLAISLKDVEPQDELEEQEWQKKKIKQRIKSELKKAEAMTKAEADQIIDIWALDLNSRWRLYRYWIQLYQQDIRLKILTHEQNYQELSDRLTELRQRQDLHILQKAKVIGMTTTGAAKYRRILQEVEPRIVIVEEAAEVLEAHIITTLSSACQHLILIGDHQQLRPSANVYDLARTFNLEVSLFERLIESELPFVRLNYQHRMRPEIAQLLTPHIYKELENHPSVLCYEDIKGVASNLFFVKHNILEQNIKDGKSHQNLHEAQFIVELCKYLLHQEYKPSQITILTTYTGQLYCLRKLMPAKLFSGVKVHVVDKYQGEENDIILLSLVRSNKEAKVGFLNISNRVCVALSRAKKGLYCIGNMDMLSRVPLWSHILGTLKQRGQVDSQLILSCQNHPDVRTCVSNYKDFMSVPEGGCDKKCEFRLNCGHVCTRVCHPYDQKHEKFQCNKNCSKVLCKDGHKCQKKCFQPCGDCMIKVEKTIPSCGHKQMMPCSLPVNEFHCTMPCEKKLHCGHPCQSLCGSGCTIHCLTKVDAKLKCGHVQQIKCWQARDLEFGMPVRCRTPCHTILSCGHRCSGSCDSCFQGRFHEGCRHPCKAVLVCSHECQMPCRECPPCSKKCQNRCIHSQCKKKCGEKCVPCMEPCDWRCQHYRCTKLCSEPCDRPPCNSPCEKTLRCGHPCIGLCGEPCPKLCRECNKDEVTEVFFGFEDENDACFVQLEDCGHILESKGMDIYMEGQSTSEEEIAIRLKECPKCKTPIRKNLRYGSLINKTLNEIEKVKERMAGPDNQQDETIDRLRNNLWLMADVRRCFADDYDKLEEQLNNSNIPLRTLQHLENMMLFYERLAKLFKDMKKVEDTEKPDIKNHLLQIKKWLENSHPCLTEQRLSDLQTEVARFTYLLKLLAKCKEAKLRITPEIQIEIQSLRDILESNKRFTDDNEIFVKRKLEELDKKLPSSGLGITDTERVMIVQAMGLTKGHWYKCSNGHIYCITECGGAMQLSRCPECKQEIGGENHTLVSSNRLASEMDGAQHAAWSDIANNMMNFQGLLN